VRGIKRVPKVARTIAITCAIFGLENVRQKKV
jgi:hypothetical protein